MEEKEKKKRWRPSLTAYRSLEDDVSRLKEHLAASETRCVEIVAEHKKLMEMYRDTHDRNILLSSQLAEAEEKVTRLMGRGLFDRIMNREA